MWVWLVIDDRLWDRRTEQSISLNVVQVQCYTKEVAGKRAGIQSSGVGTEDGFYCILLQLHNLMWVDIDWL